MKAWIIAPSFIPYNPQALIESTGEIKEHPLPESTGPCGEQGGGLRCKLKIWLDTVYTGQTWRT